MFSLVDRCLSSMEQFSTIREFDSSQPIYDCCRSLFWGTTKDTEEEFDLTVDDWDGKVLDPFNQFLHCVYRKFCFCEAL